MLSAGLVGLCLVLGLILGSVDLYNRASRPLPFKQLGPFSSSSVSLEISSNEKKNHYNEEVEDIRLILFGGGSCFKTYEFLKIEFSLVKTLLKRFVGLLKRL